jgi:hemoglobin/transferrin/lactoferrin receptor protein
MKKMLPFNKNLLAIIVGTSCINVSFSSFAEQTPNVSESIEVWGTTITNDSILQDEIDRKQANHLSDLLRDQAGIDVGGSHSIVQGINIRGVDDLDLNITVDGISQNNNMFHHSGNVLINADILKAVDIKVGTNSVLTGGLSGGVAFETKDAKDLLEPGEDFGARLYTNLGSNDYAGASIALYGQLAENVDALAYYTNTDRNNFENGEGKDVTGNEGRTVNSILKLGWDVNESNRLVFSYDRYNDEGDYYIKTNFGAGFAENSDAQTEDIDYTRTSTSLAYELDKGDAITLNASIYRNVLSYIALDTEGNSEHTGYTALATSKTAIAGFNHVLRYGVEGVEQVSKRIASNVETNKDTADSHAIYIEDEIAITEQLFITPGARYNYYKVDMFSEATNDSLNKSWNELSFALAAKYLINDQWSLNASATELFQGPGLRESYVNYATNFDQNVKPETGVNKAFGFAFQDKNMMGLDSFNFSLNVFKTRIEDYIDNWVIGKGRPIGQYVNSGDYDIDGFESTISLRKNLFSARLSYSKSDSEQLETGEQLRYEVGDSISLNLAYEVPEYDLKVNWTSLVNRTDDSVNTGLDIHKVGYQVHNISMQWLPSDLDALSVTLGVENIFDKTYYSHASYASDTVQDYEAGRNIKLSASYIF